MFTFTCVIFFSIALEVSMGVNPKFPWRFDGTIKVKHHSGALADVGWTFGPLGLLWRDSPLLCAVRNDDLPVVQALLKAGASPDPNGQVEELRKAAWLGHAAIVQALLGARAVPDARGHALQGAVRNGHDDVAQALKHAAATQPVQLKCLGGVCK